MGEAKLQIYWSLSNQGQGMFLRSLDLQTRLGGCGVGVGGGVWRVVGESLGLRWSHLGHREHQQGMLPIFRLFLSTGDNPDLDLSLES